MMSTKKGLYRPAPERVELQNNSSLAQGSATTVSSIQVKQGMLEMSKKSSTSNKPLTSTMKSAVKSSVQASKPVVVCHHPDVVHSHLRSSGIAGHEIAKDTAAPPKVVVFSEDNKKDVIVKKKSGKQVYRVKSKYKLSTNPDVSIKSLSSSVLKKNSTTLASQEQSSSSLKTPQQGGKPGRTSTPSSDNHQVLNWDESVIGKANPANETDVGNSYLPAPDAPEEPEIQDLDVLYCRYIHQKCLYLQGENDMKNNTNQAISQLMFLREKNVQLEKEAETLENRVAELEHMYTLKCQLEQQRKGLAPVVDKLLPAMEQYRVLCENLDTTRHHLPLLGIEEPDYDELEKQLEETRILVGQINILTNSKAPIIQETSAVVEQLSEYCKEEANNIPEAKKNLSDVVSSLMRFGNLVCQVDSFNKTEREKSQGMNDRKTVNQEELSEVLHFSSNTQQTEASMRDDTAY